MRPIKPPPKVNPPKPPSHLFEQATLDPPKPYLMEDKYRPAISPRVEVPARARSEYSAPPEEFDKDVEQYMRRIEQDLLRIVQETDPLVAGVSENRKASYLSYEPSQPRSSMASQQQPIAPPKGYHLARNDIPPDRNYSSPVKRGGQPVAENDRGYAGQQPKQQPSPVRRKGGISQLFETDESLRLKAEKQALYSQQLQQQMRERPGGGGGGHKAAPAIVSAADQEYDVAPYRRHNDDPRTRVAPPPSYRNGNGESGGTGLAIGRGIDEEKAQRRQQQQEYRQQLQDQQHQPVVSNKAAERYPSTKRDRLLAARREAEEEAGGQSIPYGQNNNYKPRQQPPVMDNNYQAATAGGYRDRDPPQLAAAAIMRRPSPSPRMKDDDRYSDYTPSHHNKNDNVYGNSYGNRYDERNALVTVPPPRVSPVGYGYVPSPAPPAAMTNNNNNSNNNRSPAQQERDERRKQQERYRQELDRQTALKEQAKKNEQELRRLEQEKELAAMLKEKQDALAEKQSHKQQQQQQMQQQQRPLQPSDRPVIDDFEKSGARGKDRERERDRRELLLAEEVRRSLDKKEKDKERAYQIRDKDRSPPPHKAAPASDYDYDYFSQTQALRDRHHHNQPPPSNIRDNIDRDDGLDRGYHYNNTYDNDKPTSYDQKPQQPTYRDNRSCYDKDKDDYDQEEMRRPVQLVTAATAPALSSPTAKSPTLARERLKADLYGAGSSSLVAPMSHQQQLLQQVEGDEHGRGQQGQATWRPSGKNNKTERELNAMKQQKMMLEQQRLEDKARKEKEKADELEYDRMLELKSRTANEREAAEKLAAEKAKKEKERLEMVNLQSKQEKEALARRGQANKPPPPSTHSQQTQQTQGKQEENRYEDIKSPLKDLLVSQYEQERERDHDYNRRRNDDYRDRDSDRNIRDPYPPAAGSFRGAGSGRPGADSMDDILSGGGSKYQPRQDPYYDHNRLTSIAEDDDYGRHDYHYRHDRDRDIRDRPRDSYREDIRKSDRDYSMNNYYDDRNDRRDADRSKSSLEGSMVAESRFVDFHHATDLLGSLQKPRQSSHRPSYPPSSTNSSINSYNKKGYYEERDILEKSLHSASDLFYGDITPLDAITGRSRPSSSNGQGQQMKNLIQQSTRSDTVYTGQRQPSSAASAASSPSSYAAPYSRRPSSHHSVADAPAAIVKPTTPLDISRLELHHDEPPTWADRSLTSSLNSNSNNNGSMPIAGKPSKQVEIEIKRVITHSDLPTADQVPDNRLYGKDKDKDHLQVGAGSSRPRSGQPWPYSLGVAKTDLHTNPANTKTTSSGLGAYRDVGFEDDDPTDEELHVQLSSAAKHSSLPPSSHAKSNGVDQSRPLSGPGQSQAGGQGQRRWDKSGAARSAVVAQLTEQSMASLLAGGNVGDTNHPSSYDHNAENDLYSYDPNFDDEE